MKHLTVSHENHMDDSTLEKPYQNHKIFISHSSDDEDIGEILVEALIKMGIKTQDLFFSSQYRTGVKLGKDFSAVVRDSLNDAELVILLLTDSFYQSEYCLNEMGAVWASQKDFIPILLGGLTHEDMKGFIDRRYIAIKPSNKNYYKIFEELKRFSKNELSDEMIEPIFKTFVKAANKKARTTKKEMLALPEIEKDIINNRYTDEEILLFYFFVERKNRIIKDGCDYDFDIGEEFYVHELEELQQYFMKLGLKYKKALASLVDDELIKVKTVRVYQGFNEFYTTYSLKQNIYRDLIAFSDMGKNKLAETKEEYLKKAGVKKQ